AAALAAGAIGCTQCDTCDDFPTPCTGPNCGGGGYGPPESIYGPVTTSVTVPANGPATIAPAPATDVEPPPLPSAATPPAFTAPANSTEAGTDSNTPPAPTNPEKP